MNRNLEQLSNGVFYSNFVNQNVTDAINFALIILFISIIFYMYKIIKLIIKRELIKKNKIYYFTMVVNLISIGCLSSFVWNKILDEGNFNYVINYFLSFSIILEIFILIVLNKNK